MAGSLAQARRPLGHLLKASTRQWAGQPHLRDLRSERGEDGAGPRSRFITWSCSQKGTWMAK